MAKDGYGWLDRTGSQAYNKSAWLLLFGSLLLFPVHLIRTMGVPETGRRAAGELQKTGGRAAEGLQKIGRRVAEGLLKRCCEA